MNPISKFDEKKNRVPKQIIRRSLSLALVLTMLFSVLPLLSVSATETLSLAAGDYLRLNFDAPLGDTVGEPRFDPADIPSEPYREVVDAVQFLTDGGYGAVTLCVTGHPAMNYDDSLSLYDIEDGRLADAPFARNVGIGMTAAIDFSRQGVALVREYSAPEVVESEARLTLTDGTAVSLSGFMPPNASVSAEPLENNDAAVLYDLDITIRDGDGKVFQPLPGCPVTVRLQSASIQQYACCGVSLEALHMYGDGTAQRIPVTLSENGVGAFSAVGFSEYIIRESEDGALVTPRRFYHFLHYDYTELAQTGTYQAGPFEFLNKADDIVSCQIIKDGDVLENVPIPPNKDDEYFYGWYVVEPVSVSGDTVDYRWTADPERVSFTLPVSVTEQTDTDIYLAPLYSGYRFITFHENEEGEQDSVNIITRKLVVLGTDNQADIQISDVRAQTPNAEEVFWGWSFGDRRWQTVTNNGNEIYQTVTVTADTAETDLYPVFLKAHWITFRFESNEADYVPAQYLLEGDTVDRLPTTNRIGYNFAGWFTEGDNPVRVSDADGNVVSGDHDLGNGNMIRNGAISLDSDLSLAPRWQIAANARYTVVIWKQKRSDSKTAAVSARSYDYEMMDDTRLGVPNTSVTSSNADRSKNYTGFHYSRTEVTNNGVIKPDGSTIVNVYYDRDLMAINFYYPNNSAPLGAQTAYVYTATTSTTGTQYGLVGDQYVQLTRAERPERDYSFTYQYTEGTSNSANYGIYNQEFVYLYRNNGRWYRTRTGNYYYQYSNEYTGTRYSRSNGGDSYTGQRYVRSNNTFVETDAATGSLFGKLLVNGEEVYSELTVTTSYYWKTPSGEEYEGTRFTRSSDSNHRMVTWTGLYGSTFEKNGYDWADVSSHVWRENSNSGAIQTMLVGFSVTANPYRLYRSGTNGSVEIRHYKQKLDGTYSETECEIAKTSSASGTFNFSNKFDGFTVSTYSNANEGFSSSGGSHSAQTVTSAPMSNPFHVYHTRNTYKLEFRDPITNQEVHSVSDIPFGANIADYVDFTDPVLSPSHTHYEFKGWCEDKSGQELFDFDSPMPCNNKIVYAGWKLIEYRVEIDPNGGELNHPLNNQHTYFEEEYGIKVFRYNVKREYVPDDNGAYVYMYITYTGENGGAGVDYNFRNALYIPYREDGDYHDYYNEHQYGGYEDPVTHEQRLGMTYEKFRSCIGEQRYRPANDNEVYSLVGWYRVMDNGTLYSTPYNFDDLIESNMKLRAVWRLEGRFYIAYNPVMTGANIGGSIPKYSDPEDNGRYIDQATALIYPAPTGIPEGYVFEGWRIVDGHGNPLGGGRLYAPGDEFTVDAQYADSEGCIHMEAFYAQDPYASSRKVSITSLILDANGGTLNDESIPAATTYIYADTAAGQLHFEKQKNNIDVRLGNYYGNFTHEGGLKLLGWHPSPTCENYIPKYRADAVIGIDKNSENILYAVWEPEVYITLENHTSQALTTNIGFPGYSGVINKVTDEFGREPFERTEVTIAVGGTLRLALPSADGAAFKVSGVYTGNKEKLYIYNTGGDGARAYQNQSYEVSGALHYSPTGVIVSFYDEDIVIPPPTAVDLSKLWTAIPSVLLAFLAAALSYFFLKRSRRGSPSETL